MLQGQKSDITDGSFYCVGVNYRTADESVRGDFSLSEEQQKSLLNDYKNRGIEAALVVSTCNRTEIYGFATHPFQLIGSFMKCVQGDINTFEKASYIHKNGKAINHFLRVGTGLDSQILGDFEIVSQIKKSFRLSKATNLCNSFLERLFNEMIQASKRVKNETSLSSGTTSVAFAAVRYILDYFEDLSDKNILLFGAGKIGVNTCENLVKYALQCRIVLVNRTEEKAQKVAGKFDVLVKPVESLQQELSRTDILIVATGSQIPVVTKNMIPDGKEILILDLSIPKNVHDDVRSLPNVKVISIDTLSKVTDEALESRKHSIPKAEQIVESVEMEFQEWLKQRRFAPVLKALKDKLNTLKDVEIELQRRRIENFHTEQAEIVSDRFIKKITTHFAHYLKSHNDAGNDTDLKVIKQILELQPEKL